MLQTLNKKGGSGVEWSGDRLVHAAAAAAAVSSPSTTEQRSVGLSPDRPSTRRQSLGRLVVSSSLDTL